MSAAEASGSPARPAVQLVSGRLSKDELAAIAVAVSAMSVTSRVEAEERQLAESFGANGEGWSDPVHRLPRSHTLRKHHSEAAWLFSDR